MSLHPVAETAEIAVLFPEQSFIGKFGRLSQFDASADADGVMIRLERRGDDPRGALIHLDHGLLAEILGELAEALRRRNSLDPAHRAQLLDAAGRLCVALGNE